MLAPLVSQGRLARGAAAGRAASGKGPRDLIGRSRLTPPLSVHTSRARAPRLRYKEKVGMAKAILSAVTFFFVAAAVVAGLAALATAYLALLSHLGEGASTATSPRSATTRERRYCQVVAIVGGSYHRTIKRTLIDRLTPFLHHSPQAPFSSSSPSASPSPSHSCSPPSSSPTSSPSPSPSTHSSPSSPRSSHTTSLPFTSPPSTPACMKRITQPNSSPAADWTGITTPLPSQSRTRRLRRSFFS